tara:strand:+ start:50 stop:1081 length:1032 start_codon:yes stop_codon:yes gene_type:complete
LDIVLTNQQNRIHVVDYLRGFMALGIMIYHYLAWTYSPFDSSDFMGRVGIYGVSTFYVLSGMTLYYVYHKSLLFSNLKVFFIKRVFRIFPLMWLCIALNVVLYSQDNGWYKLFLNLTGLFGFVEPQNYIVTGAWSIGNELVFYTLFPLVIFGTRKFKFFAELFFIFTLIIGLWFAFYLLPYESNLANKWTLYVNPFNQAFLFFGGLLIAKWVKEYSNIVLGLLVSLVALLFWVFYPASGEQFHLHHEWNRIVFSLVCVILAMGFLFMRGMKQNWLMSNLGEISYSLYLVHPIVFWYITKYINRIESPFTMLMVGFSISFIISYIIYHFVETPFIKLGKKITSK